MLINRKLHLFFFVYQLTILLLHVYAGASRGKDNFLGKSMPVGCEFCADVAKNAQKLGKTLNISFWSATVRITKKVRGKEQLCSGEEHSTREQLNLEKSLKN